MFEEEHNRVILYHQRTLDNEQERKKERKGYTEQFQNKEKGGMEEKRRNREQNKQQRREA